MSFRRNPLESEIPVKHSSRLSELDSLRGFAALGVLLFHYTYNQPGVKSVFEFRVGITAVDLFFMISGFVILLSINRIGSLQEFVVYRFSRLYPTYWVGVIITSLFIIFYDPQNFHPIDSLINLTMIQTWFSIEDLDGSYWTLLVELLFYLWIIGVYAVKKIHKIEDIGFLTLLGIVAYHYFRQYYPVTYAFVQLKFPITNHFPLFFSGILFYQLKYKGFSARIFAFMIISILTAFYLHDKGGRAMYMISYLEHDLTIVFYHLIFALLITGNLKFLIKPVFVFLGNISYSLYILHQYIGRKIIDMLVSNVQLNIYEAIFINMIFVIGLAYIVNQYVESPVIKFVRDRYKKRRKNKLEARLEVYKL